MTVSWNKAITQDGYNALVRETPCAHLFDISYILDRVFSDHDPHVDRIAFVLNKPSNVIWLWSQVLTTVSKMITVFKKRRNKRK